MGLAGYIRHQPVLCFVRCEIRLAGCRTEDLFPVPGATRGSPFTQFRLGRLRGFPLRFARSFASLTLRT